MALRNKLLLLTIERNDTIKRFPARVNLDLDLDGRLIRTSKKVGYLSSRLNTYKKQLDPLSQQTRDDSKPAEEPQQSKMRQTRRRSLQLLPKLHQYSFPFQQVPTDEGVNRQKSQLKISMKGLNEQRKKKQLKRIDEKDEIDSALLKMLADEDEVLHKKIKIALENSRKLSRDAMKRKSVDPRIENMVCEGKELSSNNVEQKIREGAMSRRLTQKIYETPIDEEGAKKNKKKTKELKGWDLKDEYDVYQF